MVASPIYCKIFFSLLNIFSSDIHMLCVDQSFPGWVKIHIFFSQLLWKKCLKLKNAGPPKLRGFVPKLWPVLAELYPIISFFPHRNNIWLNQTSVFTPTSDICLPAKENFAGLDLKFVFSDSKGKTSSHSNICAYEVWDADFSCFLLGSSLCCSVQK